MDNFGTSEVGGSVQGTGPFAGQLVILYFFAWLVTVALVTELFRIPLVVHPSTFAFAATIVIVAAVLSGLLVRRKLDHLDLVAVLKSRE